MLKIFSRDQSGKSKEGGDKVSNLVRGIEWRIKSLLYLVVRTERMKEEKAKI